MIAHLALYPVHKNPCARRGAPLTRIAHAPLGSAIAAWLALSSMPAGANTVYVTNCNDSGGGSLRQSVSLAAANSGDTIDLTGLAGCSSVISLTTGEITIAQDNLTLHGPPDGVQVKYDGAGHARVFKHTGTGTLRLENLIVTDGEVYASENGTARGGCIYSAGDVYLSNSRVTLCKAKAPGQISSASGGGVFAAGKLEMHNSTINYNITDGFVGGGGGANAHDMVIVNSTISGNNSKHDEFGGGLSSRGGSIVLEYSTVSGNEAGGAGGGIAIFNGGLLKLANSTVSSNHAVIAGAGGIYVSDVDAVTVQNSTIAFNTADTGKNGDAYIAAGLAVQNLNKVVTVTLQSAILSNNTYGGIENDFSTNPLDVKPINTIGANNLVRVAFTALPTTGLITGTCPLLGLLRDNGGATQTHALLSRSVAIDAGNNDANLPSTGQHAAHDQRKSPYVRIFGAPGAPIPKPDIGAYEVQHGEIVFNTNFEGCP